MSLAERVRDIKRFDHIINVLFKYGFGFFIEKIRLKDRLTLHQRLDKRQFKGDNYNPEKLRKAFEEIGGAFIKFAQFLSIRPDLVPLNYIKELEKLQDKVPAIPVEDVVEIIEGELKKPLKDVFKEFDDTPIASASIAQVHRAMLFSGEEVAIKIQRPNIKNIMKEDIDLMLVFANYLEKHNHQIKGVDPAFVVNEFKEWTEKELDFEQEASNLQVFGSNFSKDKNIVIPKLYPEFSTLKIITMEFIDGIELNDIEKVKEKNYDVQKLIKTGLNCVLKQVFIDGFFHADPHPGNILVLDGERLAFVDFGIVGVFDEEMKDNATNLFIGVVRNDINLLMQTLIDMGIEGDDMGVLRVELENKIKPLQGAKLEDIVISKLLEDIVVLIQKHGFKVPVNFILFGKTIMTLEGLALKYDEGFRFTVQSRSFVEKIIKKRKSPKEMIKKLGDITFKFKKFAEDIPGKSTELLQKIKEANINLKYIDKDMRNLIMEMDKSFNRITFGMIIAALIIASTMTLRYNEIKIFDISAFSFIGYSISCFMILIVVISMLKEKRF